MAKSPASNDAPAQDDELRRRIAECAYYRAERRGFAPGYEMEDWVEAEKEICGDLPPEERRPYVAPGDRPEPSPTT